MNSLPTTELNMRCAGVKRLLKEASELHSPNEMFSARPMEDNLFEWHFSVRGPPDSIYADGVYHGRIVLPAEYPMKPPNLILLTPNGRFETNTKICLSISGFHPETWLPSWSIRTALLALIGFMPTHSAGAVGGLECSDEERRRLAVKSLDWHCESCGVVMKDALPKTGGETSAKLLGELKIAGGKSSRESGNKTQLTPVSKSQNIGNIVNETQLSDRSVEGADRTIEPVQNRELSTPQQPTDIQANVRVDGTGFAIRSSSSVLAAIFESPILWICVLSVLFMVLFCRRIVSP